MLVRRTDIVGKGDGISVQLHRFLGFQDHLLIGQVFLENRLAAGGSQHDGPVNAGVVQVVRMPGESIGAST